MLTIGPQLILWIFSFDLCRYIYNIASLYLVCERTHSYVYSQHNPISKPFTHIPFPSLTITSPYIIYLVLRISVSLVLLFNFWKCYLSDMFSCIVHSRCISTSSFTMLYLLIRYPATYSTICIDISLRHFTVTYYLVEYLCIHSKKNRKSSGSTPGVIPWPRFAIQPFVVLLRKFSHIFLTSRSMAPFPP